MREAVPEGLFADAPPAEREREYSPSSCIGGDYRPFLEAYRTRSGQARQEAAARGGRWSRCHYGAAAAQALELCVPREAGRARACPLFVFVHGGYWQELSAADSLFAAAACIERDVAFAALDYTLAPAANVPAIIDECTSALAWLAREGGDLGIDARRIVVAGSSAGAHLAAAMAQRASAAGDAASATAALAPPAGLAPPAALVAPAALAQPAALVLLSGIYWLEPLIGTSVNHALALAPPAARQASPGLASVRGLPPTLLAWGQNETRAFQAQSRRFAERLREAAVPCLEVEVPARNHFDIVFDLAEAASPIGAFTFERLGRPAPAAPDAGANAGTLR